MDSYYGMVKGIKISLYYRVFLIKKKLKHKTLEAHKTHFAIFETI